MSSPFVLIDSGLILPLVGVVLLATALGCWREAGSPRRLWRGLFWALFGLPFLVGDLMLGSLGKPLTHRLIGLLVLTLGLIAGMGYSAGPGSPPSPKDQQRRRQRAALLGHRLFLPVLAIPVLTVAGVLLGPLLRTAQWSLMAPQHLTLAALTLACLSALLLAWRVTGDSPRQALQASQGLIESIGWPLLLPLMLAMLGGVFLASHTGQAVETLARSLLRPDSKAAVVAVYTLGMAAFTMVMGNAFAAFPVMAAGVALPFLIQGRGANPAAVLSIGMLCGYCGTLMTPMAANFNIVPAALLNLQDRHAVIKAQLPTALLLLALQTLLLYLIV
ncbi:DUF979 family protein [Mitsuaria sp. WAJ17]|uniref:5-oxoproline transporter, DUF979 family subunit n=1 Tax=Mitsuaria sp. WAJ17 TaxID=2761452 RepID=UPI0016007C12|nr:DUF979 family protein [Mitsuaria sp. WAJ17]MBB2487767.1 DUF979 family protein [Mitsuaria sp. WAJ17]